VKKRAEEFIQQNIESMKDVKGIREGENCN